MNVYVVIECVDGETRVNGVYAKHQDAEAAAIEIAEYAGLERDEVFTDTWCGDDYGAPECNYVLIEIHEVL